MKNGINLIYAGILAAGMAIEGWFIGHGFIQGRAADRFVIVKGVSEREVKADVALWPLRFVSTDDDLNQARMQIKQSHEQVLSFLKKHGIKLSAAEVQKIEVTDRLADQYRTGPIQSRYIVTQTVMVRTKDIEAIIKASQAVGHLIDAGVVLSSTMGTYGGPTFLFTGLSDLKPDMIAEATSKAHKAAEQFAKDSGSQIGAIQRST